MSNILNNYSLKNHNTFGVDAKAKHFASFSSKDKLVELLKDNICKTEPIFILGGGSNILFTQDFDGLVLANNIKGIEIITEDSESKIITVGAGEIWHDFVLWSIQQNLSGIENLSLIPGLVGASPMQNIGAYGVEVKEVITKVKYIDIESGKNKSLANSECNFDYRNSIFKNELKGRVIITEVTYKLSKTPLNNTKYGAITDELKRLNKEPSPQSISEAVINIRSSKLPNPKVLGNSGSFFKNPTIETTHFEKFKKDFPEMVGYRISETQTKISAGWLIENTGLRGYRKGDAGVHNDQALVLVNYGNASGTEIINLAKEIQKKIKVKYGVDLETEVSIL